MITQMIKKLYFVIAILVFALTYAQRIGIGLFYPHFFRPQLVVS